MSRSRVLLVLLLVYAAASLIHFAHNAQFLDEYPNMPVWLSPGIVYAVWVGITAIGVAGYLLFRRGHHLAGLAVLGIYAILGFGGLDHYTRAPVSAHTSMMNSTILLEAATAGLLLTALIRLALKRP
jgi:multidrug transporter EmrE-like cation transporter